MTEQELNKRLIVLNEKRIPQCNNVITIVYVKITFIILFDADNLSDVEKNDLVNSFIRKIQKESNITSKTVKRIGDVFFVY